MNEKFRVYAWETDSNGDLTGKERIFVSKSCREVIRHLTHELNGDSGNQAILVKLPNGNRWYARRYQKVD